MTEEAYNRIRGLWVKEKQWIVQWYIILAVPRVNHIPIFSGRKAEELTAKNLPDEDPNKSIIL